MTASLGSRLDFLLFLDVTGDFGPLLDAASRGKLGNSFELDDEGDTIDVVVRGIPFALTGMEIGGILVCSSVGAVELMKSA